MRVRVEFVQARLGIRQTNAYTQRGKLASFEPLAIIANFQSQRTVVAGRAD